jgi:hypothetical protein
MPDPNKCVCIQFLMEIETGKVAVNAPMDTPEKKKMCMNIIGVGLQQIASFPEQGIVLAAPPNGGLKVVN